MGADRRNGQFVSALLLILLVGITGYSNSFNVPFAFDDKFTLLDNSNIRSFNDFYAQPTRYVAYLTFALNYHLGGYNVVGYHILNLIIHLLASLLVFLLLRLTFSTPYFSDQGSAGRSTSSEQGLQCVFAAPFFIPLFAALLFVAHPIQTQAVTYVIQRMTSLTTLFYLLAIILYVKARFSLEKRAIGKVILLLTVAAGSAVLAMKTKEIAFTLPLAVVLYEFFFFRGNWMPRVFCLLPILSTLPVVPLMVLSSTESAGDIISDVAEKTREQTELSRHDYLCTQFRVIVTYLRLLIFPIRQNVDYSYPVYRNFFSAPVFTSFLLLLGLALLAFYLFLRTRSSAADMSRGTLLHEPLERLVSFGIFWFFLTLAVESSFIPIVDVIFEHRLYLPSVGAALVFATGFYLALRKLPKVVGNRLGLPIAALLIVCLTVATFQRNHIWGDELRLWQDVVNKSPNKSRPYINLGFYLNRMEHYAEAGEMLNRAIVLDPLDPRPYNNLAVSYIRTDRSYEAIPLLNKAISLNPLYEEAYINLAAAHNQIRQFHQTIKILEQHLGWLNGRIEVHYHLGVAYAFLGDRNAAMQRMMLIKKFGADDFVKDLQRLLSEL